MMPREGGQGELVAQSVPEISDGSLLVHDPRAALKGQHGLGALLVFAEIDLKRLLQCRIRLLTGAHERSHVDPGHSIVAAPRP
jgi:hypothetical protein